MDRVGDRQEKMEGDCSIDQSPQRAVVPMEEEEPQNYLVFSFKLALILKPLQFTAEDIHVT
jgi:hypothetical protein